MQPDIENELLANVRPYSSNQEESGCDGLIAKADEFLDAIEWAKRTGRIWVGKCIPGVWGPFLLRDGRVDSSGQERPTY
jgi:hypothetical protein